MVTQNVAQRSGKLRWLLWLRWKMFTRGFARGGASRIVSTIILGLVMLGGGAGLAIGTWSAYRFAPVPVNSEVLFLVLAGLFLIWIILPILSINLNEGLDLSKLALFPLTRGELLTSMLFSTLLDIPTLGVLLVLGAVVAGWATTLPLALLTFVAVIIFYVQLIAINQLVLALLQPLLHSRRFRDLGIILTVVLASSGYLCNLAIRGLSSAGLYTTLQQAGFSPYLQWLPPGMAARAIQQASIGNWGMSIVWLGALVVVTLIVLYLGLILVQRGITASMESQGTGKSVRRRAPVAAPASMQGGQVAAPSVPGLLPKQVTTLMIKDLKYFWRDPQIKALFLQSLASVAFLIVAFAFPQASGRAGAGLTPWMVLWVPNVVLFSIFTFSYNTLGFERQSLTTLMLFPIPPKYILWAKNLTIGLVGAVEILLLATIAAAVTHGWSMLLPGLAIGLAGLSIIIGMGNFTSIFFPQKMRAPGRGFNTATNTSAEQGCLRSVIALGALLATAIVLLPVILGVVLPALNGATWIWAIVLPGALVYGGLIYLGITLLVAPRILDRTPEILAVVTRE